MTDFVDGKLPSEGESAIDIVTETTTDDFFVTTTELIDFSKPKKMIYCPTCTMPPEYCQYGANFDACLPWILENCPEAISEELLAQMVGNITVTEKGEDGEAEKKKKKRGGGAAPLKKATVYDTKVLLLQTAQLQL